MLSEKQVLEIVPVGRTTLYRMEKAGRFPNRPTLARTGAFGSKTRSSLGRKRLTSSIRTVAGAKGVASVSPSYSWWRRDFSAVEGKNRQPCWIHGAWSASLIAIDRTSSRYEPIDVNQPHCWFPSSLAAPCA